MTNETSFTELVCAYPTATAKLSRLVQTARNHRAKSQIRTALAHAYLLWRLAMSEHASQTARGWFIDLVDSHNQRAAASQESILPIRFSRKQNVPYNSAIQLIFALTAPNDEREVLLYASALKHVHLRCAHLHITSLQPIKAALRAIGFSEACRSHARQESQLSSHATSPTCSAEAKARKRRKPKTDMPGWTTILVARPSSAAPASSSA